MAVTYGFYNSINGDRRYSADQMGSLFDGIINDGIYQAIGNAFAVTPGTGLQVVVDTGRAWFENTWILNDSKLLLNLANPDLLQDRIDAIIIEVNKADAVRANSIKVVTGTKGSIPTRPTLTRSGTLFQYPLAWVNVSHSVTSITAGDITNNRGASPTPWVTGPLKTMDATTLYNNWANQYNTWFANIQKTQASSVQSFIESKNAEFEGWFQTVQNQLNDNQAAYLSAELIKLKNQLKGFTDDPTLYEMLLDSDGKPILDSNSTSIDGRIVYQKV